MNQEQLRNYARLLLKVGVNLQPKQGMEQIKAELMNLRNNVTSDVREMLREQGMTSATVTIEQIQNTFKIQTTSLIDELLRKTNLATVSEIQNEAEYNNVTIEDEDDEIADSDICVRGRQGDGTMARELAELKRKHNTELDAANVKKRKYMVGYHHGRLQVLPAHFQFPKMTTPQLIANWLVGSKDSNVPLYWSLSAVDLKHIKNGCKKWNCMKSFMCVVERYGRKYICWKDVPSEWDYKSVTNLWETIEHEFMDAFIVHKNQADKMNTYGRNTQVINNNDGHAAARMQMNTNKARKKSTPRRLERSWKTVYNSMSKMNIFQNKKNKQSKDIDGSDDIN
jgi:hypothetical protein